MGTFNLYMRSNIAWAKLEKTSNFQLLIISSEVLDPLPLLVGQLGLKMKGVR